MSRHTDQAVELLAKPRTNTSVNHLLAAIVYAVLAVEEAVRDLAGPRP